MAASASPSSAALALLIALLLLAGWASAANQTQGFRPRDELRRYRRVQALLRRLNKPALRTIQARACAHLRYLSCLLALSLSSDNDTDGTSSLFVLDA
jgi:hypothetical protein